MREIMNYDAEFRSEEADRVERLYRPALAVFSRPFKAACASGIAACGISARSA